MRELLTAIMEQDVFKAASQKEVDARKTEAERLEAEQERRAREKWMEEHREELAKLQELTSRFSGIARRLGFEPDREARDIYDRTAEVKAHRPDGAELYIRGLKAGYRSRWGTSGVDSTAINVHADYAGGRSRTSLRGEETPMSINISLAKTDDQIVSEIQRRLLPYLERGISAFTQRVTAEEAAEDARNALIGMASKTLGFRIVKPDSRNEYPYLYGYDQGGIDRIEIKTDYNGTEAKVTMDVKKESMPTLLKAIKAIMK